MSLPADRLSELRRLVRAGREGVVIGDGVRLTSAIFFSLHGLAVLSGPPTQRAVATRTASIVVAQAEYSF